MDAHATVLSVSHSTVYHYATAVETAQHLATIRPRACMWQTIVAHQEHIDPSPSYVTSRVDGFGNDVLYFSLDTPHESLRMTSETTVQLLPRWRGLDPAATPAWEDVAQCLRYQAGSVFYPEAEFCFASPNIVLSPELQAYARQSFEPGVPVVAGAISLMHRIHTDFEYAPTATAFDTPAAQAFRLRLMPLPIWLAAGMSCPAASHASRPIGKFPHRCKWAVAVSTPGCCRTSRNPLRRSRCYRRRSGQPIWRASITRYRAGRRRTCSGPAAMASAPRTACDCAA